MQKPLLLSEFIPLTIQGEGPFTGVPSQFIRFSVCNLQCVWCDSQFSWDRKYKSNWQSITNKELQSLCGTETPSIDCVLTGGEPLLWKNNINFMLFLSWASSHYNRIVIETNGTVSIPFTSNKTWISCSPKLSNSNMPLKNRYKKGVLNQIHNLDNSYFKFVVSSEKDIEEIKADFGFLNPKKIWLMACAKNKEELEKQEPRVLKWCIQNGYNFSTRLHMRLGVS